MQCSSTASVGLGVGRRARVRVLADAPSLLALLALLTDGVMAVIAGSDLVEGLVFVASGTVLGRAHRAHSRLLPFSGLDATTTKDVRQAEHRCSGRPFGSRLWPPMGSPQSELHSGQGTGQTGASMMCMPASGTPVGCGSGRCLVLEAMFCRPPGRLSLRTAVEDITSKQML